MMAALVSGIAGWTLVGLGALLSLGAVADEIRMILTPEPYARRLIPPEAHLPALLLTGIGTLLAVNWKVGLAVLVAHGVVSLGIVSPILERRSRGF